jgi:peroxiredoxin
MRRIVALALLVASPFLMVMADDGAKDTKAGDAKSAPAISLTDTEGKSHTLEQYKDKIVVIEWTEPGCPYIVRHAKAKTFIDIQSDYKDKGVVVLGVCTSKFTDAKEMKSFREKHGITYPVLMDTTGEVGRAFHASNTPHMFVIQNGKIVYEGAIDDDPRGRKDKATNYVRNALDDLIANKTVSKAKTKPYG